MPKIYPENLPQPSKKTFFQLLYSILFHSPSSHSPPLNLTEADKLFEQSDFSKKLEQQHMNDPNTLLHLRKMYSLGGKENLQYMGPALEKQADCAMQRKAQNPMAVTPFLQEAKKKHSTGKLRKLQRSTKSYNLFDLLKDENSK